MTPRVFTGRRRPTRFPETLGSAFDLQSIGAIAYGAQITIGDGQTFSLDVDTGSTTLGVAGATCNELMVTPEWTPDATAVDQGQTTMAEYGDQSTWTGETYSDLAGRRGRHRCHDGVRRDQRRDRPPGSTRRGPGDHRISSAPMPSVLEHGLVHVERAPRPGCRPSSRSSSETDIGHLWFGGFEPTSVVSPPQFTPLFAVSSQQPFFALQVNDTTIAGTSIGLSGGVIADTGTSLMVVPTAVEDATITSVEASAGFQQIFPGQTLVDGGCLDPGTSSRAEIDAALPPMVFTLPQVGGGSFTLTTPPKQTNQIFFEGSG